jgi:hypothetical protein
VSKRRSRSGTAGSGPATAARRSRRASASADEFAEARLALASRLRAKTPELEAGLASLIDAISSPGEVADHTYLNSLHDARTAILEYAVDAVEAGERHPPEIPPAVLAATRLAARSGIALDTILRRYSIGNAMLGDILVAEAEQVEASAATLRRLLHQQATVFDRLLAAVSEAHVQETRALSAASAEWRREYIKSLLVGRQPDPEVELDYDLEGHHVALTVSGAAAEELARELAKRLDRRLLTDGPDEALVWACWLGGRRPLGAEDVLRALRELRRGPTSVTLGEPGEGLSGWRLSHRQAMAALAIAERSRQRIVRYADVAVLASVLRDDLGTTSLRQLYLEPLEGTRDGGKVARETLRTYFATQRNISSTAAALGVDRHTVTNRIRTIEELFGRPLGDIATDLETALRLAD